MPIVAFVHPCNENERILEVIYPAQVTALDVADYTARVRRIIDTLQHEAWSALVDQSQLRFMPAEMVKVMSELNAYAQRKGMRRSARVVTDAVAQLQAWRMTKEAALKVPARSFTDRESALDWLRTGTEHIQRTGT